MLPETLTSSAIDDIVCDVDDECEMLYDQVAESMDAYLGEIVSRISAKFELNEDQRFELSDRLSFKIRLIPTDNL